MRFIAPTGRQLFFRFFPLPENIPADKRGYQARLPAEFGMDISKKSFRFHTNMRIPMIIPLHRPDSPGVGGVKRSGLPSETFPDAAGMRFVFLPPVQEYPEKAQETGAIGIKIPAKSVQ